MASSSLSEITDSATMVRHVTREKSATLCPFLGQPRADRFGNE